MPPPPIKQHRAHPMTEWQPIETAPRDGTRFWAFQASKEAEQYICWWKEDFAHWEGWQTVWDDEPEPTHWMPLPDPPADQTTPPQGSK